MGLTDYIQSQNFNSPDTEVETGVLRFQRSTKSVVSCFEMDLPDLLDLPDLPPVVNLVSDDEDCALSVETSQHDKTFIDLDFKPDVE